jgi:plasmid replication initiation protein
MIKNEDVKSVTVAQANTLTQSRYDFTVVEKRAVYFIIREVRRRFIERTDGQKNLFENLIIQMATKDLQKHDLELKEVYKSLISLRKKSILVDNKEEIFEVGYINYFKHKKHEPFLEVEVSKTILPFLVELAGQYTEYDLLIAMTLKTKYTQRFYEYCAQYRNLGFFKMSVDELRDKLRITDKYPRYALLKKKVLDVAQKELKELYDKGQCDMCFTYTGEPKEARTPKILVFKVIAKPTSTQVAEAPTVLDLRYKTRVWLDKWLKTKERPKNTLWVDTVMSHLDKNPDLIPKLYKRLDKLVKEEPTKNHAAIARHIIEEDFLP